MNEEDLLNASAVIVGYLRDRLQIRACSDVNEDDRINLELVFKNPITGKEEIISETYFFV